VRQFIANGHLNSVITAFLIKSTPVGAFRLQNLALRRRIAVMLFKRHPSQDSMARKSRQAGWHTDFLEEILCGSVNRGNE
jgi:predicted HTH domain antitoxin